MQQSALEMILRTVETLSLIGGCAYLIGWQGWSPWWFALAFVLLPRGRGLLGIKFKPKSSGILS